MKEPIPARVVRGTPTITISRDDAFLVCESDGGIQPQTSQGLFVADTRLLSGWEVRLEGRTLAPRVATHRAPVVASADAARFELTGVEADDPDVGSAGSLDLRIDRRLDGGLHEDLDLRSTLQRPVRLRLEVRLAFDFADLFEVRAGRSPDDRAPSERGRRTLRWDPQQARLRAAYANGPFRRGLELTVEGADRPPAYEDGRLAFLVDLEPAEAWHVCLRWRPLRPGRRAARSVCLAEDPAALAAPGERAGTWPRLEMPDSDIARAWARAVADLDALRLRSGPGGRGPAVPAAGIPWYLALFGRDSLICSLQALPVFPEYLAGSLLRLAALQATGFDPLREMQPGKILHELRHDELTELGRLPYGPTYASHDATSLFVIGLAEAHRWSADRALVERLLPAAERAVAWLDGHGDRDGDGLQEYAPSLPGGYRNQGWKDSWDGIPAADGGQPSLPIALVELQGYAYAAKLGLAGLFDLVGRGAAAEALRAEAARLRDLVNDRLWWEAEGTYYLGLDGTKRPIASVASNAGHLLWSGIVPPERAGRVVARLLAPDMWSGWGIRTLSAAHPGFDPLSYHRGSVWPHDNGLIAAGFGRYGYVAEAAQVARAILDAAARFADDRLPELFGGQERRPGEPPVPYPDANVPQAWAAGAVLQLVPLLP
ncbi:MAG TPA: glycogen debranching N-terminal domain-containing protein [Candidatus Limnocylindrales bacterium]|nr:glycogen debranching N-terminal domain-containing protein [Candidatus Limnocylindrales bacterium]